MSKQPVSQQTIVLPRLRESRVPWMELEDAVNCSNALGDLLGTHIIHSLEDGAITNPDIAVGVDSLAYQAGRRLKSAFDAAHDAHNAERKIT